MPKTRNLPTAEGYFLGDCLAALYDEHEPEVRASIPNIPDRCATCAFRAGTLPNGCPSTVMDALKCIIEGHPFLCHTGMRDGEATAVCAGYLVTVGSRPMGIDRAFWKFSDEYGAEP